MIEGEIILWAAVLGLLVAVIWALKYVIKLERHILELHSKVDSSVGKKIKAASKKSKKK